MTVRRSALILPLLGPLLAGLALAGKAAHGADPSGEEFFEKEVRPLLVEHCAKCHGEEKPKGGLKLTSKAKLLAGGESGPAAVSGKPEESLLVAAIRYQDEPKMPPKGKLGDREIATLTRWVRMGMPWPESKVEAAAETGRSYQISDEQRRFWSFRPISDPPAPEVEDASWPRGEIDRFLLSAMEGKGLTPAPPADKRTLIRRASYDLTGLPPTTEEVAAFLADESPEAFARVVDRLLASPRYGERWARHWLDIVRYADARDARGVGGAEDITEAWRYRDWVVSAFNNDLPYDRFVRDQIAGDLVPHPTPGEVNADGLVATGLLTIGEWGTGDADKEKMLTDIVDDQIDVVGRAFLGLTIACARCHDHKFDPIPTADYYGLAGIFFSTKILPDPGPKTNGSPMLRTPIASEAVLARVEAHKARLADLDAAIVRETGRATAAFTRSILPETSNYLLAAWEASPSRSGPSPRTIDEIAASRKLHAPVLRNWMAFLGLTDDGRLLAKKVENVLGAAGVSSWVGEGDAASVTVNPTAADKVLLTFKLPARSVSVHPSPTRGIAVSWESPVDGEVRISGRFADSDPVCGDGIAWRLDHRSAGIARPLGYGDLANGASENLGPISIAVHRGDAVRVTISPRGSHICDTTTLALTIAAADGSASWDLASDLIPDPLAANPHADRLGHPDVWRFTETDDRRPTTRRPASLDAWGVAAGSGDRAKVEAAAAAVQSILDRSPADGETTALREALTGTDGPFRIDVLANLGVLKEEDRKHIASLVAERDKLRANPPPPIPLALAAQEGGVPKSSHEGFHDARIHVRGQYQRLGEVVPRHFPRIVAGDLQPPITSGSGRRELADWIARAEHPLTARVMANRLWQYHFGEGIVRTPSNFGKLGEPPSNPELLDFLARRLVANGWSIKAVHREIMLSSAYRQSGAASADAMKLDPENRLFGRMNRRRLEAEELRDGLLAASGRLDLAMGGPATRDFRAPRRTLYLMTIRSDRSSFGPLFDAADATAMVDRRTVSTVAPQALFLLNHPFVLEQAKGLAAKVLADGGDDDRERIERLYLRVYGRPPIAEEVEIGIRAVSGEGDRPAAWEAYCQILLCANEFLYVD